MKKSISLLLVLVISLSLLCTVNAASPEAKEAADALHDLGLFQGVGTNQDGTPNYDLDRAPTRMEAVTMLVRLLGKEEDAKSSSWDTPFTDVAEWAKPYVGYAYTNKLTNGISATAFGGTDTVTATQYITFVLRALGYDSNSDFKWDAAWELSDKLHFTKAGDYNAYSSFTRGDVAIISNNALYQHIKGENFTLLDMIKTETSSQNHNEESENIPEEFTTSDIKYLKYKGKTYEFKYSLFAHYALYSSKTMEPYYLEFSGNMGFDLLDLVFEEYKVEKSDNPYIEGVIYPNAYVEYTGYTVVRNSQRTVNSEYLSREEIFCEHTIEYNGKTFKSISAKEFINAGLKDGDTGVHNGVRYYVNYRPGTSPNVYYNMNDIAKYFGVNRQFHFDIADTTCLVVD